MGFESSTLGHFTVSMSSRPLDPFAKRTFLRGTGVRVSNSPPVLDDRQIRFAALDCKPSRPLRRSEFESRVIHQFFLYARGGTADAAGSKPVSTFWVQIPAGIPKLQGSRITAHYAGLQNRESEFDSPLPCQNYKRLNQTRNNS